MRKWRDREGNIKTHQVRTPTSFDKTAQQLERYMEFMGITQANWRLIPDTFTGRVVLGFVHDGVEYVIASEQQTDSRGRPSIKDNARVIFHLVQARCLEMRKGVETVETAFGGFVAWLTTPKLPPRMHQELQTRGIDSLPAPVKEKQEQIEFVDG